MARKKKAVHWTKLPENKERLHKARLAGAKTLAKTRADLTKLTEVQKKRRRAKQKLEWARKHKRPKGMDNHTPGAEQEKLIDAKINKKEFETGALTVAALAYAHCSGYIAAFAEANGVSRRTVAEWVGQALLRAS